MFQHKHTFCRTARMATIVVIDVAQNVLVTGVRDKVGGDNSLRGWIERTLDIHPYAYSLHKLDKRNEKDVFVLVWSMEISAILRPLSKSNKNRNLGCCIPLCCLENRAQIKQDATGIWLQFGKALSSFAPRFTRELSFMRMFDDIVVVEDKDDDDVESPLMLGTLSFLSEQVVFRVEVSKKNVKVVAQVKDISQEFVTIWNKGTDDWYRQCNVVRSRVMMPQDNEMTVVSASSLVEDSKVLRRLLLGSDARGTVSFRSSEFVNCVLAHSAELRFASCSDLLFWADLPNRHFGW